MLLNGLLSGLIAFAIIGVFHPIVIKGEYYLSYRIWPAFLVAGLAFCALSVVFAASPLLSSACGIAGFSSFWSIHEVLEQRERVRKGWFPENPKRRRD